MNQISEWDKELDNLVLRSSAKDNEAVRFLVCESANKIKEIDFKLLNEENIDAETRNRLIDTKAILWWIIERFGDPEKEMQSLDDELTEQVEYYKRLYG